MQKIRASEKDLPVSYCFHKSQHTRCIVKYSFDMISFTNYFSSNDCRNTDILQDDITRFKAPKGLVQHVPLTVRTKYHYRTYNKKKKQLNFWCVES